MAWLSACPPGKDLSKFNLRGASLPTASRQPRTGAARWASSARGRRRAGGDSAGGRHGERNREARSRNVRGFDADVPAKPPHDVSAGRQPQPARRKIRRHHSWNGAARSAHCRRHHTRPWRLRGADDREGQDDPSEPSGRSGPRRLVMVTDLSGTLGGSERAEERLLARARRLATRRSGEPTEPPPWFRIAARCER